MVKYNLRRAKTAIQLLVDVAHFNDYINTLKKNVARPRALPYTGEKEVLNELLIIGRQSMVALNNLIDVAAHKRNTPEEKKGSYQREFMAAKRKRDQAACKLEELLTGKKMDLDQRHKFLLKQYAVWNAEKEEYLSQHGELSWKERNEAIKVFWETQDEFLRDRTEEAMRIQERHAKNKQKRVVEVKPPRQTNMKEALRRAIDRRK